MKQNGPEAKGCGAFEEGSLGENLFKYLLVKNSLLKKKNQVVQLGLQQHERLSNALNKERICL